MQWNRMFSPDEKNNKKQAIIELNWHVNDKNSWHENLHLESKPQHFGSLGHIFRGSHMMLRTFWMQTALNRLVHCESIYRPEDMQI